MIRRAQPMEDKTKAAIRNACIAALSDETQANELADVLEQELIPVVGTRATRRRIESDLMASYKDGFNAGRASGRFARWHSSIWRASETFRRLRGALPGRDDTRYEKYNY